MTDFMIVEGVILLIFVVAPFIALWPTRRPRWPTVRSIDGGQFGTSAENEKGPLQDTPDRERALYRQRVGAKAGRSCPEEHAQVTETPTAANGYARQSPEAHQRI